jgi:hypothetical protein
MCFVAGDSRDGERGEERVGCKPPEAVSTFHAKEILCSSLEASHLRRRNTVQIVHAEARTN